MNEPLGIWYKERRHQMEESMHDPEKYKIYKKEAGRWSIYEAKEK